MWASLGGGTVAQRGARCCVRLAIDCGRHQRALNRQHLGAQADASRVRALPRRRTNIIAPMTPPRTILPQRRAAAAATPTA